MLYPSELRGRAANSSTFSIAVPHPKPPERFGAGLFRAEREAAQCAAELAADEVRAKAQD